MKPPRKCQFLQFTSPHFSRDTLNTDFRFYVGSEAHKTAKNWYATHNDSVCFVPLQQGGRKPQQKLYDDITAFCYEHSRFAANRWSIKCKQNFRYLDDNIVHLYNLYKAEGIGITCSESAFRDRICKCGVFIKPQRDSDLCHYCQSYKKLRKKLITLDKLCSELYAHNQADNSESEESEDVDIEDCNYDSETNIDSAVDIESEINEESKENLLDHIQQVDTDKLQRIVTIHDRFNVEQTEEWIKDINNYKLLVNHRYNKTLINEQYKDETTNTPANTIVITMDYKQNIAIGNQCLEVGSVFREKSARTILGFYIVTKDSRIYVDYVSDHKNHTAFFVKCCLRDLFAKEWMVKLIDEQEIDNAIFWSDNAGHFHNQMLLYYCLAELRYDQDSITFDSVKYKYFAANHGKSPCDSHFGKISYYYELYTATHEAGIHTTQQLCDMIQNMMTERHLANVKKFENSRKKPKYYEKDTPTLFYAYNFDIAQQEVLQRAKTGEIELQYRLSIPDIKSFGYFESSDGNIDELCEEYEAFHEDEKYHVPYSIIECSIDYRLKRKEEVKKIHGSKSTQYNLNLEYYTNSGYFNTIIVNDNPVSSSDNQLEMRYHYSVDIIPKPVETTKNKNNCEHGVDVKESVRSKTARKRVRTRISKRRSSRNHNNRNECEVNNNDRRCQ